MSAALEVDFHEDVCALTIRRPDKRNALSAEVVEGLIAAVGRAQNQRVRVIALRGEGKNFSAGFDFTDFEQLSEGDLVLRFIRIETLLQAVASSPCLTVAFAHGRNFGAGVDLFAVCRERYASADATFRMPGLKFGLLLGTRRFGELVGREQAAEIQQEAATFDAHKALEMGFVQHVCEQEAWAERLATARSKAAALDDDSRAMLYRALGTPQADADLASLVRSAARPGLKERVARYLRAT